MTNKIMVLTSPFSSIKGFIVSKPPLVLFTLCLIGFAVTTFTFAYYVEHKDELPNIDAHRDLVSFLKYLSKQKLCVPLNNDQMTSLSTNSNLTDPDDTITISVKAKLETNMLHNLSHIQGYIATSDWVSECSTTTIDKVKISFIVPHTSELNSKNEDVCVLMTGPRVLMTPSSEDEQCSTTIAPAGQGISGNILFRNSVESLKPCPNDKNNFQSISLTYEPSSHNAVMLTMLDRSIINLHLFHTSYFLLVMAVTLICYAMIKGKPISKHQSIDKIPLDA